MTDNPDSDEFRTLVEQQVGWPAGQPPRGLVTSETPWYKIGFSPGRGPSKQRARAWCDWLVRQGWATYDSAPGELRGCWMALPETWASDFHRAGMGLGCIAASMVPWSGWMRMTGGPEDDRPSDEFLRVHYESRG